LTVVWFQSFKCFENASKIKKALIFFPLCGESMSRQQAIKVCIARDHSPLGFLLYLFERLGIDFPLLLKVVREN
jgi:hypothetical protein